MILVQKSVLTFDFVLEFLIFFKCLNYMWNAKGGLLT